jgi:hypothetical protein
MSGTTSSSGDWASKAVLERIAKASESAAKSLENLLRKQGVSVSGFIESVDKTSDAVDNLETSLNPNKNGFKKSVTDFLQLTKDGNKQKEIQDKWTQYQFRQEKRARSEAIKGFTQSLSGGESTISPIFNRMGQTLEKGLGSIPVLGPMVGFAAGAFTGLAQQLFATRNTFMDMVDQGIMFGGSLTQFRADIAAAGLSTEGFATITQQSGMAIQQFGERNFLQTTTQMQGFFQEFGLRLQEGSAWFGEYLENQRLSGTAYLKSLDEHKAAFQENVKTQREMASITAVSTKQAREIQRQLAQSKRLQFLKAGLQAPQAEALDKAVTVMSQMGFSAQDLEVLQLQAITGAPTKEGADLQQILGEDLFAQVIASLKTGQTDVITSSQFAEQAARRLEDLSSTQQGLAYSSRGQELLERMGVLQTLRGRARKPGQVERAGTPSGLASDIQAITGLQNTIDTVLGQLNSSLLTFIQGPLQGLSGWLIEFNKVIQAGTGAAPGEALKKMAEAMGGENTPLGRIATSFSKDGIMSGLGQTLTEMFKPVWEALYNKLTLWGTNFIEMLASIIPKSLRNKTPREIEQELEQQATKQQQDSDRRQQIARTRAGLTSAGPTFDNIMLQDALSTTVDRQAATQSRIGEIAFNQRLQELDRLKSELQAQQQSEFLDPRLLKDIVDQIQRQTRVLNNSIQNQ